jgi:hypothetical protein
MNEVTLAELTAQLDNVLNDTVIRKLNEHNKQIKHLQVVKKPKNMNEKVKTN